jgi:formate dehydrogenase iron-sulfur subunit
MAKAILFDASKCTGCRACQIACKSWNQRGYTETHNNGTYENPPELTSQCWMRILFNEPEEVKDVSELRWYFTKYQCMHCSDATCVRVCPSGATKKHKVSEDDEEAYVVMTDPQKCIGCNYCVATCPFSACRYDAKEKGIFRCRLCFDRVSNNASVFPFESKPDFTDEMKKQYPRNIPACVHTCTSGALSFGEREEMLDKAKERVKFLKDERGRSKAQIYGEKELKGLHYIYVLEDDPEAYGLPKEPTVPAGVSIWEALVKPGAAWGGVALIGLAAAAGVNYVINRRNEGLERKEG